MGAHFSFQRALHMLTRGGWGIPIRWRCANPHCLCDGSPLNWTSSPGCHTLDHHVSFFSLLRCGGCSILSCSANLLTASSLFAHRNILLLPTMSVEQEDAGFEWAQGSTTLPCPPKRSLQTIGIPEPIRQHFQVWSFFTHFTQQPYELNLLAQWTLSHNLRCALFVVSRHRGVAPDGSRGWQIQRWGKESSPISYDFIWPLSLRR